MKPEITTIHFDGLLGYGVNCYLLKIDEGFILIDTAVSSRCTGVEKNLENAGCRPGNLKLILLTHGHGDHTANCVYLRNKFGSPIAMHQGDLEIVERKHVMSALERAITRFMGWIAGVGEVEAFTPDIFLEDGQSLAAYGLDAKVIHIPGHSNGSIGILMADGDLFCGDVFVNVKKPAQHTIVTNAAALKASIEKLKSADIRQVYPGHGRPFHWDTFLMQEYNNATNA
jgi:glyoxylase-like metal-dependent hydrolase (beta-lactamase superfamily II)